MKLVFHNKRILLLTAIMIFAISAITVLSFIVLYKNNIEIIYNRLTDIVTREKIAISILSDSVFENEEQLIKYLYAVRENDLTLGIAGELLFAKMSGDSIEYLISKNNTEFKRFKIAKNFSEPTPIMKSFEGETGTIKAKDYTGIPVYAAYSYVPKQKIGIVAKIPVSEIRGPLQRSMHLILLLSSLVIILAVWGFIRITNPLMYELLDHKNKLQVKNEEYYSLIEELKQSNQELKLSKEDLVKNQYTIQSQNEEYASINEEYHALNKELSQANHELSRSYAKTARSEKIFTDMVDNSDSLIYMMNLDGVFINLNNKTANVIGYSKDEIIGKKREDLMPEEAAKQHFENDQRILKTLQNEIFEETLRNEHTTLFFNTTKFPLINPNGELYGIAGISTDITEKKLNELELIKSERTIKLFIQHAPAAIAMFDTQMRYIACSNRFIKDYHLPTHNLIGKSHYEIFPEITDELKTLHNRCLQGEILKNSEDKFVRENGDVDWVKWEIHPWYESENEIGGILFFSEVITQQKQAELRIRESERKFRFLFENNPLPMWTFDSETLRFLYVNQSAIMKYGYTFEEFMNMTIKDIRPEEEFGRLLENLKNERSIIGHTKHWVHKLKNGERIIVDIISHIIEMDGRKAELIVAIDVSEKIAAENALIESEKSLNQAQEISHMGSWEFKLATRKNIVSKNTYNLFGLRPYEVDFTPDYLISRLHPDDVYLINLYTTRLIEKKTPLEFETRIIMPDGSIKWLHNFIKPVLHENEVVGIKGVEIDITETKRKNDELKKLSIAIQKSKASVEITNQDGTIIFVNEGFTDITQYSRDEVIGENPRFLKSGMMSADIYKDLWSTIKSGNTWKGELLNRKKNGDLYWESTIITPHTNENGEIVNFIAIKLDISKEKEFEKRLLELNEELELKIIDRTARLIDANNQLSELNDMKDKFFSIIAHDLKNPFASMMLNSELLLYFIDQGNTDKSKSKAKAILDASIKGHSLLQNLLDWAQSQRNLIRYSVSLLRLKPFTNDVVDMMIEQATDKNINIQNTIEEEIVLYTDSNLLQVILRNLISNAIKFTNKNGVVIIEAKQTSNLLEILVADNGVGMSPEILKKLFRIDTKISTKGTADESGTGLGLQLCKEFVEKLGGTIWAESTPLLGSTFHFTIPKNLIN